MKKWTVIGFFDDTFVRFVNRYEAESAEDAACLARLESKGANIVAVIEGEHYCQLNSWTVC